MNEHLKKIKETIDVEHGYSLGTVFTTRNKQYMYDTGTGKVFECGVNEYRIANYAQTECQFRYCGTAIPFLTVRSTAR